MSLRSRRPQSSAEMHATQSAGPPSDCSGDDVGAPTSLHTEGGLESPEVESGGKVMRVKKEDGIDPKLTSRLAGVSAGLRLEPGHSRAFREWPVSQGTPACGCEDC